MRIFGEPEEEKQTRLDKAFDEIRGKFGHDALRSLTPCPLPLNRNTRAGIEASMAGDCEEVNPTAALLNLSNAGRHKRFRKDDNRQNS